LTVHHEPFHGPLKEQTLPLAGEGHFCIQDTKNKGIEIFHSNAFKFSSMKCLKSHYLSSLTSNLKIIIFPQVRIHSYCNYMSPNEFEKVYKKTTKFNESIAS
jgi:hypothetical protein